MPQSTSACLIYPDATETCASRMPDHRTNAIASEHDHAGAHLVPGPQRGNDETDTGRLRPREEPSAADQDPGGWLSVQFPS